MGLAAGSLPHAANVLSKKEKVISDSEFDNNPEIFITFVILYDNLIRYNNYTINSENSMELFHISFVLIRLINGQISGLCDRL